MRSGRATYVRTGVALAICLAAPAVSRTELRAFEALGDAVAAYDVGFHEHQRALVADDGAVLFIERDASGNPLPQRWLANGRRVALADDADLPSRFVGNGSPDGRVLQLTAFDDVASRSVEYRVEANGRARRVSPPGLPFATVTAWSRDWRHAAGTSCDATHCVGFRWDAKRGARLLPYLDPASPNVSSHATHIVPDGSKVFGLSYGNGAPQFVRWDESDVVAQLALPGDVSYDGRVARNGDVVVGESCGPAGCSLFRWEAGRGATRVAGDFQAVAVSDDGDALVARDCDSTGGARNCRLLRWDVRRGFAALGAGESARFVDPAGRFVLGSDRSGAHFAWDAERGRIELRLPGDAQGRVETSAREGGVLAGRSCTAAACRAFRWTTARGLEEIAAPRSGETLEPGSLRLSPDGDVALGRWCAPDTGRCRLARWTESTNAAREVPSMNAGFVWGDAVVGTLAVAPGEPAVAAIWDEARGTRPLRLPGHVGSALTLAVRGVPALLGRSCARAAGCETWLWTADAELRPLRDALEATGANVPDDLALDPLVQSPDGRWLAGWDWRVPGVFRIDLARLIEASAQP